jgi:uncharacterized protein (DUF1499 family)
MIIHDLSTDGDDPPAFVALREVRLKCANGADYSGPRGDKLRKNYPDIAPPIYTQSPAVIFKASTAAAQAMGWAVAAAVEAEGRIEATATTRLLRFKDDVVIRIRAQGGGARLDVRSTSRIGGGDLGTNARRIRTFLHEINNRLKTNS